MPDGALPLSDLRTSGGGVIDLSRIDEGGAPGGPRRVMLFAALDLLAGPRVWMHRGRGPEAFDWLGFVRRCAGVVIECCFDDFAPPADLTAYSPAWGDGPSPAKAEGLFQAWGMVRRPVDAARPGDILLFAMPGAHAAVVTGRDSGQGPKIAHAYWGRALTETLLDGWWRERAISGYGWP